MKKADMKVFKERLIDAVLERIEEGSYGRCDECGAAIPKTRLKAIPYTSLCIKCAEQSEQG